MKEKKINDLAKLLRDEMFLWWQLKRKGRAGFTYSHEQKLYDACCQYLDREREK